MTPADREFALKALDDSRERLVSAVKGLSRAQLEFRPAAGRWSVAENLEYLILVVTQEHLRARFFRHPMVGIGEIDSYQWLLLIGAHCDRHRTQSEGEV